MTKLGIVLVALSAASSSAPSQKPAVARIDETPLQFVGNYVSELGTFENIRRNALAELKNESAPGFACIHNNARYDLEASATIRNLRQVHLVGVNAQLQEVPAQFAQLYELRQKTMAHMTAVCTAFAEGPKDGVDYKGLAAMMPKIRAQLDYLDHTALEGSPLVFATLVSDVPDSQGHAGHLVITCDERKRLVDQIDRLFGSDFEEKETSSGVEQARMIRSKVLEFKCADEPR